MHYHKNALVKKNGITNNKCLKETPVFFVQFSSREQISVPIEKPDIEEIVSVILEPEIISLNAVNTAEGVSFEGQHLTGKKIIAEIKLKQKIMYIAAVPEQSLHVVENYYYQSAYVVIPPLIKGSDPNHLIKSQHLQAKVFVEDIFVEKTDKRNMSKTVQLIMQVKLIPTYEICYSEDYNCTHSNLYIVYENGTKKKQITFIDKDKITSPQWSPCGQKIAFICYDDHSCGLCISDINKSQTKQITDSTVFPSIGSFCWSSDGSEIYFSAYRNNHKELFAVNVDYFDWRQLSHGLSDCKYFKPKCSFDGNQIAYQKTINKETDLFIMSTNGLGSRKLTSSGYVKDFDWSNNSKTIAYVLSKDAYYSHQNIHSSQYIEGNKQYGDNICLVDIDSTYEECLPFADLNTTIKKILFSPDNRYLAFIGKRHHTEDVYLYDFNKNKAVNLTNNDTGIEISDFIWNIDSTTIYFSANDLVYYNIYSIPLDNKLRTQISNTTANNINLSYRPKIK